VTETASPRGYYEHYVKPSLAEWRVDKASLRRATTLANQLKNLGDRLGVNRNACVEYAIICDVGNGEKHVTLTRGRPRVSTHGQTQRAGGSWGDAWGEAWGNAWGARRIVVTEDDGTQHEFAAVMEVALRFLEERLGG
jgi:hypothetical protein